GARVHAVPALQGFVQLPCLLISRRRHYDFQFYILVTWRCSRQAASFQPQPLPGAGTFGDLQIHGPAQGRHLDLSSERSFPRCDRQLEMDIASVSAIERVRLEIDGEVEIAGGRATRSGTTLLLEPDALAGGNAG